MRLDQCGHGKTWAETCLECELIGALATVQSFEPIVSKAKQRIKEIEREISTEAARKARLAVAPRTDRKNDGVPVGNGRCARGNTDG